MPTLVEPQPSLGDPSEVEAPRLRRLLDLPGAVADATMGSSRAFRRGAVSRAFVEAAAFDAPRANGYLALEDGLVRIGVGDHRFALRVRGRTAFAVGGILGPASTTERALRGLLRRLAEHRIRRLLLFPVADHEVAAVRAAGLRCVEVGAEAVLDPARLTLDGGRLADVRQMYNRARGRFGLRVVALDAQRDRLAIESVYREWIGARPAGHAMRLLVGTPCLDFPARRRFFGAVAADARSPHAIVSITPGWGGQGWGVDVMARRHACPAGAIELLLVEVARRLAREGAHTLSLAASPMVHTARPDVTTPAYLHGVFRYLYGSRAGNALFRFRSLAHFKNKFAPDWKPVLIAGWPSIGPWGLYVGCRMWGLFGPAR